jgi:hypothetical protein
VSLSLALTATPALSQQGTPSLDEMWRIIQDQQNRIEALEQENEELREQAQPGEAPASTEAVAVLEEDITPTEQEVISESPATTMEIYGHAMLDMGYQFKASDPDWFDVVRPTKLPAFKGQYGDDGSFYAGVRQSRLGFKTSTPTAYGDLKTLFEFEMFGVGSDAGQTTIRLRHAWGELGQFGAGQYWSVFMDIDVFPNSIEYWGPNAMVFYRNVQARWTPWSDGDSRFAISLERPGASGDGGEFSDFVELRGIEGDFEVPDLAAHYRWADDWGHVQLAGILRRIEWNDNANDGIDLSGSETGWGLNLSTNYRIGPHVLRGSVVYGEGIQNYMNDASADIGVKARRGNPRRPIQGETIPLLGLVGFLDLNWSDRWTSTIGYSVQDNDLPNGAADTSFERGQYALANILWHPVPNVFVGPEIQWAKRDNYGPFSSEDFRIQVSAKYNFSQSIGGF